MSSGFGSRSTTGVSRLNERGHINFDLEGATETRARKKSGAGRRRARNSLDDAERVQELYARFEFGLDRANLSLEEACGAAGVTVDFMRNLKRGGVANPGFFRIIAIAAAVGLSPYYLAQLSDDPDADKPDKPVLKRGGG